MSDFNELRPYMRITILVDPDTLDYQVDVDGTLSIIKAALHRVAQDLEREDVVERLSTGEVELD